MNDRSTPVALIVRTPNARGVVSRCAVLVASLALLPLLTVAQSAFTEYRDVQRILTSLTESRPPELSSSDPATQQKAWENWVADHDREIRKRLVRGDEDTVVNWLLFGTSFTRQPRAFFDAQETPDTLRRQISQRTKDLIETLRSADGDERAQFARQLLREQGYGFNTIEEQARLQRHLYEEVDRVVAERQEYMRREEAAPIDDAIGRVLAQSNLFRDRGLSLDTSILPSFAIEQALETMKRQGLLAPNGIRRVAVIGPGLDFADKNSGNDSYPVQTMQPLTAIDSLLRLGLVARTDEIELTTFDISPRVNEHIKAMRDRARSGVPYILRLPMDSGSQWTPALISYWKTAGDRIGPKAPDLGLPVAVAGTGVRAIEVQPQVAARITAVNFNVVTERWAGPPFDLVIATNVLVYYDTFDQALAFSAVEAMLRPGAWFLTNNVVVELSASRLRSAGLMTVQHSDALVDRVFWYRRN